MEVAELDTKQTQTQTQFALATPAQQEQNGIYRRLDLNSCVTRLSPASTMRTGTRYRPKPA